MVCELLYLPYILNIFLLFEITLSDCSINVVLKVSDIAINNLSTTNCKECYWDIVLSRLIK